MAMHIPKSQLQSMMKDGTKHFSGMEEAVYKNIDACSEIAKIVRTSMGPNGMNKMILNHLDKLFVTNDAATIIRELEIQHPAAKMIIMASQMQEREVGDGTNLVMIFAGKLLEKAGKLLKMGLSQAEVIQGYDLAIKKALEILPELECESIADIRSTEGAVRAIKTSVASKQWGNEDFLASLIAKACTSIMPDTGKNFNVDNVRVVKILGSGVGSSQVIQGMVFRRLVESDIKSVENAKMAVYSCPVDWTQTETKGTVLINNAKELENFSKGEEDALEAQVKAIVDTGINVVVSGGSVGDMALHFMNKYNIMVVRLMSKFDLRRLCRATGSTALPRLTPPSATEIGHADKVYLTEIGGSTVTVFSQNEASKSVATVVIRGSTINFMDDIERAVDDGVNIYKAAVRDPRYVPGGGATEMELAKRLTTYGETRPGLDQYAITAFAEALEVVPFTLAENVGQKPTEVVAKLYAAHQAGQANAGIDNLSETSSAIRDSAEAGIIDNFSAKYWALKFATNAANTVLLVDQIIMAKTAGGPKVPKQ